MDYIKEGAQIKYIGETNYWTFKKDLNKNSIGTVKTIFKSNGKTTYQVEFENGITTSLDLEDLEKLT